MKKSIVFKSVLIAMVAIMMPLQSMAYDFTDDEGLCYNINDDGVSVTLTYENSTYPTYFLSGDIEIPESVENDGTTYSVTSIGVSAFGNCSDLNSVTIPGSVTSIDEEAFFGCTGLTSITLPNSLTTIGERAFYGCIGLTSLAIPSSVITIADFAFEACSGLTSVTIPNSVTSIGSGAFSDCSGLMNINSLIENPSAVTLDSNVFSGVNKSTCQLSVPVGTVNAYRAAAQWSEFTNITDGQGGGDSNNITFADSQVKSLCVANWDTSGDGELSYEEAAAVTSLGTVFKGNTSITSFEELQYFTGLTTINDNAFDGCSHLTKEILPEGISSIGNAAFRNCRGLIGDLVIPNSVTIIGYSAFYGCSGLTGNLVIPNSVTEIGSHAFYNCSGFTGNLVIPNSVTSIGNNSFENCSGLTGDLVIPSSVITVGPYTFSGCRGFNGNLVIPNTVTSIGVRAFNDCSDLTGTLNIPNSVILIDQMAFYGCSGFTGDLVIPDNISSISKSAFQNCRGLSKLTIPNSVISIGETSFFGCSGLAEVTIPSSVTSIGRLAFSSCSGLTTVIWNAKNCDDFSRYSTATDVYDGSPFYNSNNLNTIIFGDEVEKIPDYICDHLTSLQGEILIPNSVITIGDHAFSGCSGLTSVSIPNSVTTIRKSAFIDCSGLISVNIPNSISSIENSVFYNCSNLTSITIPNSVTSIGSSAFFGCEKLSGVLNIPNSVTSMGSYAFWGCSGLSSVIIPNSIHVIENSTFKMCKGLTSVNIPSSVTSIGDYAFEKCDGLTSIAIPSSVTSIGKYAFSECSGLSGKLTIPNSVTSIGDYAFYKCSGFTGILTLSNSITSIGKSVFARCSGFTGNLVIPNSVTSIGGSAFSGCSGFTGNLVIPNSVTSIESSTFQNCSGFTGTLTISNSVTSIGGSAFNGCSGLTGELIIPNLVASIGSRAFASCNHFTSITIPNSTTSISSYAFSSCTRVNNIYSQILDPSAVDLGTDVFSGINKNTCVLTVPPRKLDLYKEADQWKDFVNIVSGEIDYDLTAENLIITTAHQLTPIVFNFKNFAAVKGIEFDIATSTWLNATGTVTVKTGAAEPSSVDFVSQPVFTLTERFIGEMDETKWMYLFGQTDLVEYPNMLNGAETEKGLDGTVAIHMGEEVQTDEGIVVKEYLEAGEGELFAINLYPLISGDHSINISNVKLTLVDGTEVELDPFTINVKANRVPGDLNDDGVVDENDVPGGAKKYYNLAIDAGNIVTGEINKETLMPISLHNTGDVTAFSCTISLPERIQMVDDINSFVVAGERGENVTFTATQNQNGTITINGTATTPLEAGDGAVLNLKVKSSWQNTYSIPVTNMTITTASGAVEQLPNSVTKLVLTGTRGDMNGDGRVDLSDALYIINLATGLAE